MAYGTVIRMCDKLNLNPVDFTPLNQKSVLGSKIMENRVMQYYVKLNKTGRKKALELMEDYAQLDKYKAVEENCSCRMCGKYARRTCAPEYPEPALCRYCRQYAPACRSQAPACYKSVRQFAIEMEIPYSTLVTALDRGIEGMAYGTVINGISSSSAGCCVFRHFFVQ